MQKVLMAMLAGCLAAGAGSDEARPVIPACSQPPRMDGRLDDSTWNGALAVTNFVVIGADAFTPAPYVTARLMRDAAWLYVGFDVVHPQPLSIVPKFKLHDDPVQRENCVKVALDPGTGGKQWYHFRLSPGNVRAEQRNSARGGFEKDWRIPWRSAARITEQGWQAELALPFALLMELGDPAQARLNLLVHIFTPILDPYGVEIGQNREVAGWAATPESWWTTPERFVPVGGLADAAFQAPFLPLLENARVGGYVFADGKYQYEISGLARNSSGRAGRVTLRVKDQPVAGEAGEVTRALDLAGGADAEFKLAVPVRSVVRRNIQVEMAAADGEILERILIENPPVLDLFAAYLDRDYYTAEKQAGVVCRIGLPPDGLQNTRLSVRTDAGKLLGETAAVKPLTAWTFPLADVKEGTHPVRIEFRQADGALIADQAEVLIKRPPKPGREWKIDRARRMVLQDGQPYFAYGILMGGWNRAVYNDENYRDIAEAGFNCLMYWAAPGTVEETLAALNTVHGHNMHMVAIPLSFVGNQSGFAPKLPAAIDRWGGFTTLKGQLGKSNLSRPERSRIHADLFDQAAPIIRAGIEAVKDHPALMAYESFDEPSYDNIFDQYAEGRKLHRLIHATDGYHPVRVLWNSGCPNPPEPKYTDWRDIIARDPYWSPPVRGVRDSPNWVARETADLTARGKIERKPVWQTPVLEMYSGHYKRHTLPAEQSAQTYLAILYEASGIFYFVYPAVHQMTWDMMRQLGREIRAIYPIITAAVPEHQVAYTGLEVDVIGQKMPDVHAALRRNPAGGFALLAVNSQPWPVQAVFATPFAAKDKPVRRQFGPETFTLKDGVFGETIEPFGRRVYLIAAEDDAAPLTVSVAQTAVKDGYVPEDMAERTAAPGRKNIMPNPSFEENTLPGFPDYWFVGSHSVPTFPNQRTGRENARYELDAETPYLGKFSFRLRGGGWCYFKLCPQHDRPTEYVWSAWMRADREGVTVKFSGAGVKRDATFKLTREWQRYHAPVTMPRHASRHNLYVVAMQAETPDTRIWMDAMQFELGTAPTEFEP